MIRTQIFRSTDGRDIVYLQNGTFNTLDATCRELIDHIYNSIVELYPEANKALHAIYGGSYDFKWFEVRRFAKCNFSEFNEKYDIDQEGSFNLEYVTCPLRGECQHENIICRPHLNTSLSNREMEVLLLICEQLTDQVIADKLFISKHTVCNHRRHILAKINCANKAGIIDYAHKNKLI